MIRYLQIPTRPAAEGAAAVATQIRREFGLLPEPLAMHAPLPQLFAAGWAALRETVIAEGRLPRRVKEAMAMAISRSNRCPYCIDAHAIVLHALGAAATERRVRRAAEGEDPDPRLRDLVAWAAATRTADAPELGRPPFSPAEAPEAVGTALCFQYINRMATVLLGETPLPSRSTWLRRPLLQLMGRAVSRRARGPHPPGASLGFLPDPLPAPAPGWAAASPPIARAFAALDGAVQAGVEGWLLPEARRRFLGRLAAWRGEEAPLGSAWLAEAESGLPPEGAAALRLTLLTALAPYRVEAGAVDAFRRFRPGDPPLLGALAWASFEAARRISEWIAPAAG